MAFLLLLLTTGSVLIYFLNSILNPNVSVGSVAPLVAPPIEETPYINNIITQYNTPADPVCIVGAGISGLNLANILQAKGYKVVVFEKKSVVGGKGTTFRIDDEVQVDMGPVLFSPHQTKLVQKMREFGLTPVHFNESDRLRFDPRSGEIYTLPSLTDEQKGNFVNAVRSYILHLAGYSKELEVGYLNASPDLCVSIWDWLSARNLQILRPIFSLFITNEGYGALEDVPAIYALTFINKDFITDLAFNTSGTLFTMREGLDVFFNQMASKLINVQLNTEVFHVSRDNELPTVFTSVVGSPMKTYNATKCHKVVLAFPPLLSNLKSVIFDLTKEEKRVFEQVKIHKFHSAATHIPPLDFSVYFQDENTPGKFNIPMGRGEVVAFVRQSSLKLKNVFSSYSWVRGDYSSVATKFERDNIDRQLQTTVRKISNGGKILYKAEPTEYFPHVNINSLRQGFYQNFDAIQGKGGLYYATTLLGFEILDQAIKVTEHIAQRYF